MSNYRDYDQKTLDKLHKVHLEILDEFVRVCNENKLTYFLVGGTLLGAIRHKGFIPWDDDIDVGMPRADYNKFIEIANSKLNKKFLLDCYENNKDYYLPYAKIKKDGTIFDEEVSHHLDNHKGIFIDIFPFENVSDNNFSLKYHALFSLIYADAMTLKVKTKTRKMIHHPVLSSILKILPKSFLMKRQRRHTTYCHDDNSKYICVIGTGYGFIKELNLRSDVVPPKKLDFANKKYNGMQNSDKYLRGLYGDYMKLPPVEKRRNHMPLEIDFGEDNE